LTFLDSFAGKDIVVTAKMDGENTTLYNNGMHSRSLTYSAHPSRNKIKAFSAKIAQDIPEGWRICVENLYAKHSIHYLNLPDYWLGLSVWNDHNTCLAWRDTKEWFALLGIKHCQVLYEGVFNPDLLKSLYTPYLNNDPCEGYVVRLAESFSYADFARSVAKYVRPNHVQTDSHWMNSVVVINKLAVT
jgi:hypothetical protein